MINFSLAQSYLKLRGQLFQLNLLLATLLIQKKEIFLNEWKVGCFGILSLIYMLINKPLRKSYFGKITLKI